ncbi:MAG: phosphoribosylanthranilate isomerase [Candidatus Omnitrophota bacterium]
MRTRVKICGITNLHDARESVACGADFLGFVFFSKSPRAVSPRRAKAIIKGLPARVKKVGVFVNQDPQEVKRVARYCGLDFLQFHGDETPAYVRAFRGYRVIKAFRIRRRVPWKQLKRYRSCSFLFDTYRESKFGGTGETFGWKVLLPLSKKCRFFVSGGLAAENVEELIRLLKPFAVDVSSGVEKQPGKKDLTLVKRFIQQARRRTG